MFFFIHRKHCSLRMADVSPRSSPLRDVSRGGTSAVRRLETLACSLLFVFLSVKSCVFWTFCFHLRGLYKKGKGDEEEVFNWLKQNHEHYSGYSALRNLVLWTVYRVMLIEIYEVNQFMRHTVRVCKISTWKCQSATGIRQPYTVTTSMTKNFNPAMSPHIVMHQSHSLTRFEKSPVQKSGTIQLHFRINFI